VHKTNKTVLGFSLYGFNIMISSKLNLPHQEGQWANTPFKELPIYQNYMLA
jgi:hypothetical protein